MLLPLMDVCRFEVDEEAELDQKGRWRSRFLRRSRMEDKIPESTY
jgi:hypothetical protein